jgi:hypothetical protein
MFIILVAHIPGNPWIFWIPARFGFSDATETFVFCSGMASALAFGAVFAERGWLLGAARVAFRAWQVYWAHVGVFLATVAMLAAIDAGGWGLPGKLYEAEPYVTPFLDRTREALVGLLTLSYVPGLFDILPMYLVVLAMIPAVMGLHALGGGPAAAAFVATLWALANLADWARHAAAAGVGPEAAGLRGALLMLGQSAAALELPAEPWGEAVWFFNPFGWQLAFFLGFAFGRGWLAPPTFTPWRLRLALAVVVLSTPFAWFRLYLGDFYLPADWALQDFFEAGREMTAPLHAKTPLGLFRVVHFLATAYLALWLVGPRGVRLSEGAAPPPRSADVFPRAARRAAAVAALSAPWAWASTLDGAFPGFAAALPGAGWPPTGALDLVHLGALVALAWSLAPDPARLWLCRTLPARATPVIRRVGQQSLAVFMTSIPLSQLLGLAADRMGRGPLTHALVNLAGFAALIAAAYVCGWFKGHPWRGPAPAGGPLTATRAPVVE